MAHPESSRAARHLPEGASAVHTAVHIIQEETGGREGKNPSLTSPETMARKIEERARFASEEVQGHTKKYSDVLRRLVTHGASIEDLPDLVGGQFDGKEKIARKTIQVEDPGEIGRAHV